MNDTAPDTAAAELTEAQARAAALRAEAELFRQSDSARFSNLTREADELDPPPADEPQADNV